MLESQVQRDRLREQACRLAELPREGHWVSIPRDSGLRVLFSSLPYPKDTALSAISWLPRHHSKLCNTFFLLCNQQVADCPTVLSFIVNGCKRKKKKEKKQKKIPRRYNIVLSVNQTFPVMLIACVSLMYFILLKSFETLQLSSYRPLCGYH